MPGVRSVWCRAASGATTHFSLANVKGCGLIVDAHDALMSLRLADKQVTVFELYLTMCAWNTQTHMHPNITATSKIWQWQHVCMRTRESWVVTDLRWGNGIEEKGNGAYCADGAIRITAWGQADRKDIHTLPTQHVLHSSSSATWRLEDMWKISTTVLWGLALDFIL